MKDDITLFIYQVAVLRYCKVFMEFGWRITVTCWQYAICSECHLQCRTYSDSSYLTKLYARVELRNTVEVPLTVIF